MLWHDKQPVSLCKEVLWAAEFVDRIKYSSCVAMEKWFKP